MLDSRNFFLIASWIGLALSSSSVIQASTPDEHLLVGNRKRLTSGYAQSFVGIDSTTGKPIALGIMISSLKNPDGPDEVWLDLPKALQVRPFDHVEIAWTPSFLEVRFSWMKKTLSPTTSCGPVENLDYIFCGENPAGLLFRIPYDFTQETREIHRPALLQKQGYLPQTFSVTYDAGLRQFRISMEDLRMN